MTKIPIVIAGGGLVGLSVGYHLAKRGAKEVFLFERHCIGATNSTRISTGMINSPCFNPRRSLQSAVRKSHELCAELSNQQKTKANSAEPPAISAAEGSAELSTEWTAEESALKEKAIAENAWTPIYRYRGFVGVWFVLRFNLVFFAFALSSLPLSLAHQQPIAPSLGLILLASVVFVAIKKYYTRIVAVISVDTASRSIYRIGYPSLFASRRNRFARHLDVMPLANNSDGVRGIARLHFTDGAKDDFLLVPTVNVEIADKKAAFVLFGSAMQHFDKDVAPSALEEKRRKRVEEIIRQRIEGERTKSSDQTVEESRGEEKPKIQGK